MKLCIDTLQIRKSHLFLQNHLVKANNKVRVQETAVEDAESKTTSDELEIVKMLWVHPRRGVDLQSVVVVRRIFEEAVERVEHFVREEEEEFSESW